MQNKIFIKEIFESIQGEGPYIGTKQLFIRFTKCNLNCNYCDTDFKNDIKEYTSEDLFNKIKNFSNIHSISLTGGEPLLETDFLKSFLPLLNNKIYLETNGTLYKELSEIINYIDIISMDIKLPSVTKMPELYDKHEKFIETAIKNKKEIFIKIVFDENITDEEINTCINIAKKNNTLIILQPKMDKDTLNISSQVIYSVFNKFNKIYKNTRLIPQVHKFINIQ